MNTITAEIRSPSAKVKKLRREGIIPCAVYGGALPDSLSIQISENALKKMLRSKHEGSKIKIELEGKVITAQIKDINRNFVKDNIEHISFQALQADKKVNSKAQVILENRDAVQGLIDQIIFEIPYSAYPADMVDMVCVDLTDLQVGSVVTVADLDIFKNQNMELQLEQDSIVLRIRDKTRAVSKDEAEDQDQAENEAEDDVEE